MADIQTGLLEECPQLKDSEFLEKNPGLDRIANLFYLQIEDKKINPPIFDILNISTINDYIKLVDERHPKAYENFERGKSLLGLQNY